MVSGQRPRVVLHLLAGLLGVALAWSSFGKEGQVFSTWEGLEADKCASIWLIRKFISPGAEIRFHRRGATITDGIPFDTPDAQFRRYHNKATFETLLKHYHLKDAKLNRIARVVHDIEVNVWERKVMPETDKVSADLQAILSMDDTQRALGKCVEYFDKWYSERL